MKNRVLIFILCAAAVSTLSACNKSKDDTEFVCEAAYKDTLEDIREVLEMRRIQVIGSPHINPVSAVIRHNAVLERIHRAIHAFLHIRTQLNRRSHRC